MILSSHSLFSIDLENSWFIDTKEMKCKNVLEAKQNNKLDISPQGIKKADASCRKTKLTKIENKDGINTLACIGREYFFTASEDSCKRLEQFISLNARKWYWLAYRDSKANCGYTGEPPFDSMAPEKFVYKEGCKLITYNLESGVLLFDCSGNPTYSDMPKIAFTDSQEKCLTLKDLYHAN